MFFEKKRDFYIFNILGIKIKFKIGKNYLTDKYLYNFHGNNNKLYIERDGILKERIKKIDGLSIDIKGDNNIIILNEKTLKSFSNSTIRIRSNSTKIKIEDTDRLYNLHISTCCGDNQSVHWGKGSNCWGVDIYLNEENAALTIGEECMFSGNILIWPSDGHAVFDKNTNKVINGIKSATKIGNHVWVGTHATILKNADIPDDSVIGAASVVTSKFDKSNVVIAGNPAKVIKENIDWDRKTAYCVEHSADL